ncbi:MAG: Rpn family recombination-promoting nuclease/putative transposase, partial [Clostridium celatum]|nr:Rpn family recombination-promoting nuclease/putative transposase [Clostridium celatum]
IRKLELEDKAIKKAKDELYRLSLDDKERERYRIREKAMMDEISALENAEQKGIEHGIEEGEKRKSIEIARNAIKTGLDIKTIATLTGLTIDEIERLK